jgi:LPPG:FO 2-phospho-L-lactate transferase
VPEAINTINQCDVVILAPSNPWVSIDPILAIPGYLEAIAEKPVIAVSPLIGGKAVKGPAAKIFRELGYQPSASVVANHYRHLLSGFVLDTSDAEDLQKIERWFIMCLATNIMMKDKKDRVRLAEETLNFCETILTRR